MSRLIKSQYSPPGKTEKKVIHLQSLTFEKVVGESPELIAKKRQEEAEQLLQQAKMEAEKIIREAERTLQEANMKVDQIQLAWEEEKDILAEQARYAGYEEGVQLGKQEIYNQLSELINEATSVVDLAKADYVNQLEQSEETILKLGIKVAEKIMHVHLKEKQEDYLQIVRHAIKEVKDHAEVSIKVHPSMYELVSTQKDELKSLFNGDKNLFIYPNADLGETGCIIESSFGRIDASIDSQLTELKNKLLELLEED